MATIIVRWTLMAVRQRNIIFEYWNERNQSYTYSRKLNAAIEDRISILKSNIGIGKPTDFKNTRVVSLGHYSLFYKQLDSQIIITAFWDNRQKPAKILTLLKRK
ncbi:type II toxin-antitoxin system RelE/ParE family toxin [Flavobacterium sp.]|uniref:type II toxin-antitoxin system RelE/ParE family toxin n=1 Tax=Flavobacterium sp. TaxID=239 RepID=UPI004033CA6B